ncbi:MAG: hypothetical protein MRZ54_12915 [Clostridiales bacterium]|nr:hypothetical protein [Clostridiales bacterium]
MELRLIADSKEERFAEAKQAVEAYLYQNGVTGEIYLSEELPYANPVSGKYKHIIALGE